MSYSRIDRDLFGQAKTKALARERTRTGTIARILVVVERIVDAGTATRADVDRLRTLLGRHRRARKADDARLSRAIKNAR